MHDVTNGESPTADPVIDEWSSARKWGFRFVATFTLLFTLSLPFPHHYLPDAGAFLSPIFEWLAEWSGRNVLRISTPFASRLISDSTGLYIHTLNLIALSIIVGTLWGLADRRRANYSNAAYWFIVFAAYYLALQLLVYGLDKVFKWQFYLPEPNTLFTTVGETPRDLLYWSVMGASRPYTIFTGIAEVLAALLLLFRRTRTIGALLAFGILLNVAAINIGFDISVKLYSLFLLLLSAIVIAPDAKRLMRFVLRREQATEHAWTPRYRTNRGYTLHCVAKAIVICLFLFDVLSTYVIAGNFNDDAAPRPPLHGAYEVRSFIENGNVLPPLTSIERRWKRVFVHRRGYLIVQTMDERMNDYALHLDTLNRRMLLTDPRSDVRSILAYEMRDTTTLQLRGLIGEDSIAATTTRLDLAGLPLLRNEFHWTIDEL